MDNAVKYVEESTNDVQNLQLHTLCSILQRNASVDYLRPYIQSSAEFLDPFADPTATATAFRQLVPLSSYHEDYSDIIARIADGVENSTALSFDPLVCFFSSSGTSSLRPKWIPYFDSSQGRSVSALAHQASQSFFRRVVDPIPRESKILWFLYAGNVIETKSGIKVMAASAFPFQSKGPTSPLFSLCVSPPEVIMHSDTNQQMYGHLLCGLSSSASIDGIRAPYAASLVRAIRLLESKWMQLCNDLEAGSVGSEITDIVIRSAVNSLLVAPQPGLANKIREACGRQDWSGILPVLWPNLRYVACVSTGSMQQYYSILKNYAGDNVLFLGGDYFSSECPVGINMNKTCLPEHTNYVMLPFVAYFEFIPFEFGALDDVKETVDMTGVEVGKMYEVVVTTYRGLYRYRLGDIVKVVGFYNSSPKLEFITRVSTGKSEVLTERDLICAMENLELAIGNEKSKEVIDFTGFLDSDSTARHATVFIEVSKDSIFLVKQNLEESTECLRRYCELIEGRLGSVYQMKRSSGELDPLKLSVVKPGSFEDLAKAAIDRGASANQYKPPKIIRNSNVADLLEAAVICSASPES